jgi:hypothetical protein
MSIQVPQSVADKIKLALREVTQRSVEPEPGAKGIALPIAPEDVPVPQVPRYLLAEVIGLPDHGAWMEKVAWEIDFAFSGVPMTLAHRKLGVRLEIWPDDETSDTAADQMGRRFIGALRKAVDHFDKGALLPVAKAQLDAGNVTLGNRHHQLRGHYDYFREATDDCRAGRGRWMAAGVAADRLFPREQEAFINFTAAVHAYYSWLEHILVLCLPFAGFDPATDNVATIIGSGWREKYRRLFSVATDAPANLMLSRLSELAERTRNTWGHGGFDKDDGLVYVHLPGIGATPMGVNTFSRNVHFPGIVGVDVDFTDTWAMLDGVDAFLAQAPSTRYGLRYAQAGLQVMFDATSRAKYAAAAASDATFEDLVEQQSRREDRLANMDW